MISKVEQLLGTGNPESLFGMFLVSRENEGEQVKPGFESKVHMSCSVREKELQSRTTSFSFYFIRITLICNSAVFSLCSLEDMSSDILKEQNNLAFWISKKVKSQVKQIISQTEIRNMEVPSY